MAAGSPLHACNSVSERQKVLGAGTEPGMATFSRKHNRQSDPFPAGAKAGGSKLADGSSGQKRSADEGADEARAAQRPKLHPINGQLPTPKVLSGTSLTYLSIKHSALSTSSFLSSSPVGSLTEVILCPQRHARYIQTYCQISSMLYGKSRKVIECVSNIC